MSNLGKITPDGLKAWVRANRELALAVCKVRAFAELERERVDAYVRPIFERYAFRNDLGGRTAGEVLTNPREIYLSEDEERCAAYFAEVARAHQEHGWRGDPEHCPALVAEDLLVKAENALLESLAEFVGVDGFWNLDLRKRALDLALTTCIGGET